MPNPTRKPPRPMLGTGFCRFEVQKVLRKYYSGKSDTTNFRVSAWMCLKTFEAVKMLHSGEIRPLAEKRNAQQMKVLQFLGFLLLQNSMMLAELLIAYSKSEKRVHSLSKRSPERAVEESFPALADLKKYKKMGEALPSTFKGDHTAVRAWISRNNKVQELWERAIQSEESFEAVIDPVKGKVLLYKKRR